jgi:hypothetical protein
VICEASLPLELTFRKLPFTDRFAGYDISVIPGSVYSRPVSGSRTLPLKATSGLYVGVAVLGDVAYSEAVETRRFAQSKVRSQPLALRASRSGTASALRSFLVER